MTRWTPTDYNPDDFANRRHIGPSPAEMEAMLKVVGAESLDALIDQTVPAGIRQAAPLGWPALSEAALLARMRAVAGRNRVMTSLIGQGYYGTVTPPAIQRNILENPAWYTAYTPYQPEIAQGRLEALLNYQTMVADLTGLPVANASLLDEATAAAEAMAMAQRLAKSKARGFFVSEDLHPQTLAVIETRAAPLGIEIVRGGDCDPSQVFGAIYQYPGTYGHVCDLSADCAALHAAGAVAIVALDDDGRIVLVHQYRHAFGRRLWELPAGLLDFSGEEPHRSAARELAEEVGLAADTWRTLVDTNSAPGFCDESVRVFLATGLSEVERPEAHDEEADLKVERFDLADAERAALAVAAVESRDLTVTFGRVDAATPAHAMAKVAGELEFCLDMRSEDVAALDLADRLLRAEIARLKGSGG